MSLVIAVSACGLSESGSLPVEAADSPAALSASARVNQLEAEVRALRDSLEQANRMLYLLNAGLAAPSDSLMRRYALSLWMRGESDDALALLALVVGRTESGITGQRGTVFLTVLMLLAVLMGFIYVASRWFYQVARDRSERAYNRAIAGLAGLLIYFVFSVAGLSLPVLILNSLGEVRPIYAVILNFLSMLIGATATLFVGTMVRSDRERTVLLGIILGIFTCMFFIDMLFKAIFFAFDLRVLLPNTMFVLGVVLVYLFAPRDEEPRREFAEGY